MTHVELARLSHLPVRQEARTPRPARIARPDQVTTFDDLVEALAYLRRAAGAPTLKELAGRDGHLLPSTTSDLLRRKTRRPRHEVVLAFAQACGESDAALREWAEAWFRARHAAADRPVVAAFRARKETAPEVREKSGRPPDLSRRNRT
jgi:hypothetical protein